MLKPTAAAAALALTVSVTGLAATDAAQASARQAAATSTTAQTMKVVSNRTGFKLSATSLRPGNTLFKVYRGGAGGQIQVLRLRSGYSLANAAHDISAAFQGDPKAVRKVDANVVFYGGIDAPAKGVARPNEWGVNLDRAGRYYIVNFSTQGRALAQFRVTGSVRHGALPKPTGWLNATGTVDDNHWVAPSTDPHAGWMKTTNKAQEPHFPVLNRVKESTTDQDVQNYIDSGSHAAPPFALSGGTEAGVISPGHSMVWKYGVPKGKYIAMCFYPSKTNGMPHFAMGMFTLFPLH